jgi:hypothetical protein
MKKLILLIAIAIMGVATVNAQTPQKKEVKKAAKTEVAAKHDCASKDAKHNCASKDAKHNCASKDAKAACCKDKDGKKSDCSSTAKAGEKHECCKDKAKAEARK